MKESITADWAREYSSKVLSEKVTKQIEQCEKAIIAACDRNDMTCSVNIYPHELTVTELNKRGFKITKNEGNQRDGIYMIINWYEKKIG
tara:strand:+ start:1359 stop:1625 length:267 start_codon:yes stop_codon:yes gene_type:complete